MYFTGTHFVRDDLYAGLDPVDHALQKRQVDHLRASHRYLTAVGRKLTIPVSLSIIVLYGHNFDHVRSAHND